MRHPRPQLVAVQGREGQAVMTKEGSFRRLIRNLQRCTVRRWIPVAERLPEHDQPVLARFKPVKPLHDGQPPFEVCVAAFDAEKAKCEQQNHPPRTPRSNWYRYAARGDCAHYFRATHWQPLPALPPGDHQ